MHFICKLTMLVLAAGTFLTTMAAPARADELDDLVKAELTKQRIPGAAVAVVKDGKLVKAQGYGLADIELEAPARPDTVFRILSITKQFTAAGIMILAQDGKLGLDDPVSRYLDGTPPAWEKMTLRHLLTQTSGLKDFINDTTENLRLDVTEAESLKAIEARPLNFQPGDAWAYSNTNYHLLAMIIRKVAGQAYGDFLAEKIFKPLGMDRTSVIRDGEIVLGRASGYALDKGKLRTAGFIAPSILAYGGGGVRSTVLDMAKWEAELEGGTILSQTSRDQMWSPAKLNNGTTHAYGFGWELGEIAGHRLISHGGEWVGFSGHFDRFANDHLTVIVLTNLAEATPARIARAVAGTYIPAVALPNYKPIADQDPQTTERLRDVVRRWTEGGLRSDEFTPEIWAYFSPRIDQMKIDLAPLGPIQTLTLVERSGPEDAQSYRYRAKFKNTGFILHFVLDKAGKISAMAPEEVNQ